MKIMIKLPNKLFAMIVLVYQTVKLNSTLRGTGEIFTIYVVTETQLHKEGTQSFASSKKIQTPT